METFEDKRRKKQGKEPVDFAANSKPPFWLRIISGFIDTVILFFAAFGLYSLALITPIYTPVKNYRNEIILIQDNAMLETGYGQKIILNEENKTTYKNYVSHVDEDNMEYVVVPIKDVSDEITIAYQDNLNNNKHYKSVSFNYNFANYGIVCLCGFIDELIFLLAVPLFNKRRATIGQLLAGLSLNSVRYENRARWYHLIGKLSWIFVVESALAYLIMSEFTVIFMPLLVILIALINHKTNRTIHDLISGTMVIYEKSFTPLVPELNMDEQTDLEDDKTVVDSNLLNNK